MYDPIGTQRDIESEHWVRLDNLNKKIQKALSLGHQGYLDFFRETEDPSNKVKEFSAFDGPVQYDLDLHDELLFLCTLHRLKQLKPEAVLARLHSIFSRCCRFDLLLASHVLCVEGTNSASQAENQASTQEAPATDIIIAFAQNEPYIRRIVSHLTVMQRKQMISCVRKLVNNHLVNVRAGRC